MGRNVGGRTKHTKIRPKVHVNVQKNQNISKHPRVYRPKKVLTKNVQHHGASIGVHRSPETRVRQQQHRNVTVQVAKTLGYPQAKAMSPDLPRVQYVKKIQGKRQLQQGSGVVHTGTDKIKKKYVKPLGAGQRPIDLNPFW